MSNILNQIGLGNVDIAIFLGILLIIEIVLLVLIIVAFSKISKFTKKYKKFMQGKNASSLEKDIMALYEDNVFIKTSVEKNRNDIDVLFEKQKYDFQKLGIVKYDAFKEMGGKLSFSIALLDQNNDGLILNSVHSSAGCYSYTKRIKNGDSDIPLSAEEKKAVERAMKGSSNTSDGE